ncbi:hypothetical protein T484DRAFT_1936717, partial [Baffinella frigidus]
MIGAEGSRSVLDTPPSFLDTLTPVLATPHSVLDTPTVLPAWLGVIGAERRPDLGGSQVRGHEEVEHYQGPCSSPSLAWGSLASLRRRTASWDVHLTVSPRGCHWVRDVKVHPIVNPRRRLPGSHTTFGGRHLRLGHGEERRVGLAVEQWTQHPLAQRQQQDRWGREQRPPCHVRHVREGGEDACEERGEDGEEGVAGEGGGE